MILEPIVIPEHYNYISAFLTFNCSMHCHYCINKQSNSPDTIYMEEELSPDEWITGLNRIQTRPDLPITMSGGEPTNKLGFYRMLREIDEDTNIDILTNGKFNLEFFRIHLSPERCKRKAKYASIRFSYHPTYTNAVDLHNTVVTLKNCGYSVGVWAVQHPEHKSELEGVAHMFKKSRIDFRYKDFLGEYEGKLHGTYKYPRAIDKRDKRALCKPSELLIAPNGDIHRCHYYLYNGLEPLGNILDPVVSLTKEHVECEYCGLCNYCDIKSKFNRFQKKGHCSVDIKFPGAEPLYETAGEVALSVHQDSAFSPRVSPSQMPLHQQMPGERYFDRFMRARFDLSGGTA